MAVQQVRDRRGRGTRGKTGLLDRESALEAIDETLGSIGPGAGQALLVVGHPGMGKTRLHEAALDEGRARGLRVLHAAGSELEQNLAFGVASQLLRALLSSTSGAQRQALLSDAPKRLRSLDRDVEAAAETGGAEDLAVAHGLFALLAAATERKPAWQRLPGSS